MLFLGLWALRPGPGGCPCCPAARTAASSSARNSRRTGSRGVCRRAAQGGHIVLSTRRTAPLQSATVPVSGDTATILRTILMVPDPELRRRPRRAHRPHVDRRHRGGHVARRAHHPARHRQRHVDPDLRVGRVSACRAQGSPISSQGGKFQFSIVIAHRRRHDRRHRLRRVGAAPHPSAVRQTGRRPAHVRRPEHLHPAEGQPVGCDPGHLRQLDPVLPGAASPNVLPVGRASRSASTTTSCSTDELGLHRLLRAADHLLRLLLHGDRVQPAAAGRHHPQAGWVHPRHPARAADRALPRARCSTASRCRVAVPRGHRVMPAARASRSGTSASSRSAARRCSSPSASRSRR